MADAEGPKSLRFAGLDNRRLRKLAVTTIEGSFTVNRRDKGVWTNHIFPLVAAQIPGLVKLALRVNHEGKPAEAFAYADRAVHQIAFAAERYVLTVEDAFESFRKREGEFRLAEISEHQARLQIDVSGPKFDDDLAGWLKHKAPQAWTKDVWAEHREKQQWLKSSVQAKPARASFAVADLRVAWTQLVDQGAVVPRAPASKEEFDEFKVATDFALPRELKALLGVSNGADLPSHRYGELLSVAEIASTWLNGKSIYDDWQLEELVEGRTNEDPRVVESYVIPAWIPIVDENGNMIGFDRQPGPRGQVGQLVSYGRDDESTHLAAPNLVAFLQGLLS